MKLLLTLLVGLCSFACGGPELHEESRSSASFKEFEPCRLTPKSKPFTTQPRGTKIYAPPAGIIVTAGDVAEIRALANNGIDEDIILPDGDYVLPADNPLVLPFLILPEGDRLWAENLGGARIHFGISVREIPGEEHRTAALHGLAFQVSNPANAVEVPNAMTPGLAYETIVDIAAPGTLVQDCSFMGASTVGAAILAREVSDTTIRRVDIQSFRLFGIRIAQRDGPTNTQPAIIEDVEVGYINDPHQPVVGTRESGLAIESDAVVRRVLIRSVGASGITVGAATTAPDRTTATMSDIDIDHYGMDSVQRSAGVYFEKRNLASTLTNFCIGPRGLRGVNVEWPLDTGDIEPNEDVRIADGLVRSDSVGIWVDGPSTRTRIASIRFENAAWVALGRHEEAAWVSACNIDYHQPPGVCDRFVGDFPTGPVASGSCAPALPDLFDVPCLP